MPLQLLELAVIIPRFFFETFVTRTPRGTPLVSQPLTQQLKLSNSLRSRRAQRTTDAQSRHGVPPGALLTFPPTPCH